MDKFVVHRMGGEDGPFSVMDLQMQVRAGTLKSSDIVRKVEGGSQFMAQEVPGLFSDKDWMTAVLISFFLGSFGGDRFYLGYGGSGIFKLLTCGGMGLWALIDFIMIMLNKMPDSQGRPLRKT